MSGRSRPGAEKGSILINVADNSERSEESPSLCVPQYPLW